MLIFIEGGPEMFANKAFESDVLLNHPEFTAIMHDYRWTERTIRSTVNPDLVAQVWRHHTVAAEQPAVGTSPVPSAADDSHSTASDATTREVDTEEPVVHSRQIVESVRAKQADAEADTETPEVVDGEVLPDGEQLFLRRKRLKLTVQEVADAVDLNRSRVDAIEKGTAKRGNVTADVRAVHDYLTLREGGGTESPRD